MSFISNISVWGEFSRSTPGEIPLRINNRCECGWQNYFIWLIISIYELLSPNNLNLPVNICSLIWEVFHLLHTNNSGGCNLCFNYFMLHSHQLALVAFLVFEKLAANDKVWFWQFLHLEKYTQHFQEFSNVCREAMQCSLWTSGYHTTTKSTNDQTERLQLPNACTFLRAATFTDLWKLTGIHNSSNASDWWEDSYIHVPSSNLLHLLFTWKREDKHR